MLLRRTDKGQAELRARERSLSLKERSILFLADGTKTLADLDPILGEEGTATVQALARDGYLDLLQAPRGAQARAAAAPSPASSDPASAAPPPRESQPASAPQSLAATRMFLFELCERTFARGAPTQAEHYRERLRQARAAGAMLAVAQDMLMDVELIAGEDRARFLRDRIESLLPDASGQSLDSRV